MSARIRPGDLLFKAAILFIAIKQLAARGHR